MNSLLIKYAENPKDAKLNFDMAVQYLSIKHYAGAVTHFLRCAEYGDIEQDKDLIYESLLNISICFRILGDRVYSEEGWLMHAVSLCPNRPEAYWLLSLLYERLKKWQECYAMSCIGLSMLHNEKPLLFNIGFYGYYVLLFQKMVSSYFIRPEETKQLLKLLYADIDSFESIYKELVITNMKKLNIPIPKDFDYEIDVVMISWAKNDSLYTLSKNTLNSLFQADQNIKFHVVVVESNKDINYDELNGVSPQYDVKTIYTDEPFGYNRYSNIGMKQGKSKYVLWINNDLLFSKGCITKMFEQINLSEDPIYSMSPWCPQIAGSNRWCALPIYTGYNSELLGACILLDRKIFDIIGEFDETFPFHYCDSIYAIQLIVNGVLHYVSTWSTVEHLSGSTALHHLDKGQLFEYTQAQNKLYGKRVLELVKNKFCDRL